MKVGMSILGTDKLRDLARTIRQFPAAAEAAGVGAANEVVEHVEVSAARDITQELNLPASYIREKFLVRRARRASEVAVVAARKRPVRLARFAVEQITVAAPRAKGDKLRGIPAGRKQAGVTVKVKRGGPRSKPMKSTFLMPLRAGKVDGGNGMGIFFRFGDDIGQDYGPSPDQLFRAWIAKRRPDIGNRLAIAFRGRLTRELRRLRK